MSRTSEPDAFERWLERELRCAVAAELGPTSPAPRLAVPPPGPRRRGAVLRRLGLRGAVAALAATTAIAGGGAVLATGRPNPVSWGRQVVEVVTAGSAASDRRQAPTPDGTPTPAADQQGAQGPGRQDGSGGPGEDQSSGSGGSAKQQGSDEAGPPAQAGPPGADRAQTGRDHPPEPGHTP